MRRVAAAPLEACLMQEGLFERGNGMVILTRKTGPHEVAMAAFLLDAFCLGVKDTAFNRGDRREIEAYLAQAGETAPLTPVDPSYARKLLRDLVAYARSLGIAPHPDYAALEVVFGDHAAEASAATFQFGRDGRPLYIPGPDETQAQIKRRIKALRGRLGDGGFDFQPQPADDPFAELDAAGYDPDWAPDPAYWLALDDDERVRLVLDYHRQAGDVAPNENAHALLHVAIESEIAVGGASPVRRTVERLIGGGLERHDAIHAVASVLAEHLRCIARGEREMTGSDDAYYDAVEKLTIESWRASVEDDGSEPDEG